MSSLTPSLTRPVPKLGRLPYCSDAYGSTPRGAQRTAAISQVEHVHTGIICFSETQSNWRLSAPLNPIEQAFCSRWNSHFEFGVNGQYLSNTITSSCPKRNSSRGESEMSAYGALALPVCLIGAANLSLYLEHVTCHSYTLILFFVS